MMTTALGVEQVLLEALVGHLSQSRSVPIAGVPMFGAKRPMRRRR
jgi:hypothetical protein